jgi:hypothetical protein
MTIGQVHIQCAWRFLASSAAFAVNQSSYLPRCGRYIATGLPVIDALAVGGHAAIGGDGFCVRTNTGASPAAMYGVAVRACASKPAAGGCWLPAAGQLLNMAQK